MPLWVKPGSLATINALDQLRKEPELEWSLLSPSAELKAGQRTGKFRLGNEELERPTHCSAALYGRVLKARGGSANICNSRVVGKPEMILMVPNGLVTTSLSAVSEARVGNAWTRAR
jgi:hypothetical protein